jgi:S-DNA-T family DNA segregation ATPase FtsK/SpoIIIE
MGWSDDDRPVVVDLLKPEATHLLVAGSEGAGKTVLLRTMALSLAMNNKPSRLQLVVIDGDAAANPSKAYELAPLNYLPHTLTPVVDDVAQAKEILTFLVREAEYRQDQAVTTPAIVVFLDGAAHLLSQKDVAIVEAVRQLVQSGAKAGIHLILSTNEPTASYLDNLFKASFPARITGKVADSAAARAATGQTDSQAEFLLGEGDFIAFAAGGVSHFQAAFIGGSDLLQTLETLHHRRLPVLLAQTTSIRPTLPPAEETTPTMREFVTDTRDEIAFVDENNTDDEISFLDDIE